MSQYDDLINDDDTGGFKLMNPNAELKSALAARERTIAELRERIAELEKQLADGDKCACGAKVDVRECYRCLTTPY